MSLKEHLLKEEGFQEYLKQYSDASDQSKNTLTGEIEELITKLEKSNRVTKLVKAGLTTLALAGGTYLAKTLGMDQDYSHFPYLSSFFVGKVFTGITAIMTLHNYLMFAGMKSAMFKEQVHELSNDTAKEILEEKFPRKQLRVGVVGYCPPTVFDEQKALDHLVEAYDQIKKDFPDHEITIVSGLCNVGVPKLAYEEGKRREWKTAGVACSKAKDFEHFPVDETPVLVGDNWGDESETFVNSIDVLVKVGGGKQSQQEVHTVKEKGNKTYEYELPRLNPVEEQNEKS